MWVCSSLFLLPAHRLQADGSPQSLWTALPTTYAVPPSMPRVGPNHGDHLIPEGAHAEPHISTSLASRSILAPGFTEQKRLCSGAAWCMPPRTPAKVYFMFQNDHKPSQTHFWLSHPWTPQLKKNITPSSPIISLWGLLHHSLDRSHGLYFSFRKPSFYQTMWKSTNITISTLNFFFGLHW